MEQGAAGESDFAFRRCVIVWGFREQARSYRSDLAVFVTSNEIVSIERVSYWRQGWMNDMRFNGSPTFRARY